MEALSALAVMPSQDSTSVRGSDILAVHCRGPGKGHAPEMTPPDVKSLFSGVLTAPRQRLPAGGGGAPGDLDCVELLEAIERARLTGFSVAIAPSGTTCPGGP